MTVGEDDNNRLFLNKALYDKVAASYARGMMKFEVEHHARLSEPEVKESVIITVVNCIASIRRHKVMDHQRDLALVLIMGQFVEPEGGGHIVGDEAGLGKTLSAILTITATHMLSRSVNPGRTSNGKCLVIVPFGLTNQWVKEFAKFRMCDLKCQIVEKNQPPHLQNELIELSDVVIVPATLLQKPNAVRWAYISWDCVFVDEAHGFKGPSTLCSKALTNIVAQSRFVYPMTGTVLINRDEDLYALLKYVLRGAMPDRKDPRFTDNTILRRNCTRRTGPDIDRIIRTQYVVQHDLRLTPAQEKVMQVIKERPPKNVATGRALAFMASVCPAAIYGDEYAKWRRRNAEALPSAKECKPSPVIDALVASVKAYGDAKHLVFTQYNAEKLGICMALIRAGVQCQMYSGEQSANAKDVSIFMFNNIPDCRVLILNAKCGSHGLNLQVATHVHFPRPDNCPTTEIQGIARAARTGQKDEVTVHFYNIHSPYIHRTIEIQKEKMDLLERKLGKDHAVTQHHLRLDVGDDAVEDEADADADADSSDDSSDESGDEAGPSAPSGAARGRASVAERRLTRARRSAVRPATPPAREDRSAWAQRLSAAERSRNERAEYTARAEKAAAAAIAARDAAMAKAAAAAAAGPASATAPELDSTARAVRAAKAAMAAKEAHLARLQLTEIAEMAARVAITADFSDDEIMTDEYPSTITPTNSTKHQQQQQQQQQHQGRDARPCDDERDPKRRHVLPPKVVQQAEEEDVVEYF